MTTQSKNQSTTKPVTQEHPSIRESLRDLGEATKSTASTAVEHANDAVRDAYERGRNSVEDKTDDLADAVRNAPLKSLAIAAGVGLALGMIFRK